MDWCEWESIADEDEWTDSWIGNTNLMPKLSFTQRYRLDFRSIDDFGCHKTPVNLYGTDQKRRYIDIIIKIHLCNKEYQIYFDTQTIGYNTEQVQ